MRTNFALAVLFVAFSLSQAQGQIDPGMAAAQAAQQAAQQATQQANQDAMRASQQANQNAMQASQQASQSTGYSPCFAVPPKFSIKSGKYSSQVKLKLKARTRGSTIYYTNDGWTPTASSNRYVGPITINSTTFIQAVAISSCGVRSRVASGVYTLTGANSSSASSSAPTSQSPASEPERGGKVLLARDTPLQLAFASDVTSKTAEIGDQIPLALLQDLNVGGVIVARKGAVANATITEVDDKHIGGVPGEIFFQASSLQVGDTPVQLYGGAAKEGQDHVDKAMGLMLIPMFPAGVLVHGQDAEIKQGATFTAYVQSDVLLPPAN
jgi:hypothetical protein